MKKSISFILLVLLCFFNKTIAQTQINKEYYFSLLNQREYKKVYSEVCALQKKPYGKCCLTDFLIAKSLCLSGLYKQADNRFKNIFANYKLSQATINYLKTEKSNCNPNTTLATSQGATTITIFPLPTSAVNGKLGKVYNCYQSYQPIRVINEITEEKLISRTFPKEKKTEALAKIKSIIPKTYEAEINGDFILVTLKTQKITSTVKNNAINELNRTLQFYSSHYKLSLPDKFLTVYMVPDNTSLRSIAQTIHGIEIPKENYGYSSLSDLSLAGISNSIGVGTLKHELFHLMVRADIGDIPPWLDEGIATLYEESEWININNDTDLVYKKNFWRTNVLKETLHQFHLFTKLPDLETLINYSWEEFEGIENGDICKASVNYALAKHFVAYLEQNKMLPAILDSFKNKQPNDENGLIPSNVEIVEKVMNKSIYMIEFDFNRWLKANYSLSLSEPYVNITHGSSNFIRLKNDLLNTKLIISDFKKKGSNEGYTLENKVEQSEKMLRLATNQFDSKMKKLYIDSKKNGFNNLILFHILDDYAKKIDSIDKQLKSK